MWRLPTALINVYVTCFSHMWHAHAYVMSPNLTYGRSSNSQKSAHYQSHCRKWLWRWLLRNLTFTYVISLIFFWRDSFVRDVTHLCVTWLGRMRHDDSCICASWWLTHSSAALDSCIHVWHVTHAFICGTWLMHSYVARDSLVSWLIYSHVILNWFILVPHWTHAFICDTWHTWILCLHVALDSLAPWLMHSYKARDSLASRLIDSYVVFDWFILIPHWTHTLTCDTWLVH